MRKTKFGVLATVIVLLLGMAACSDTPAPKNTPSVSAGQIYLYGEQHGVDAILEKEFEIWHNHYHNDGMRHLFIEYPYYTAAFLNIWMKSDSDDVLNAIYDDLAGTAGQVPAAKDFYKQIKAECPETVFHGTDVGHQYDTTGKRFLEYLKQNGLEDTAQYALAQEGIAQGQYYYNHADDVYRENKMTENFIREFDLLDGENVMGIYGAAHTGLDAMDFTGKIPCMAKQLKEHYGDIIHSEDLSWLRAAMEPFRVDTIEVNGKLYEASYFGQQDLTGFKDYVSREYWRLENAYDTFKDNPKTGDVLPYSNYPMAIETGQVFVIDYTKTDGSVTRTYYRSDGNEWEGQPTTENFTLE